jgi:death-on-curing protein
VALTDELAEAALARPVQRHASDGCVDLADLAAAYLFGIARAHPFVDGNKRSALDTAIVFLGLNGYEFAETVTDDDLVMITRSSASGELDEEKLAEWMRQRLVALPPDLFAED